MNNRPEDFALINRQIVPSLLGAPRFREFGGATRHVAYAEMAMFQTLLSNLKPKCAIEIGTQKGATLEIIARHAEKVISLDLDPAVKTDLAGKWSNVEFLTGDSHQALSGLFTRLADAGTTPDFIFIDGDHTTDGVRQDIEHVLALKPASKLVVLMHDSFNPNCRRGMLLARWSRSPHCHFVDLDFVPGVLHPDPGVERQMWGGLGFALFLPETRTHTLEVKATHQFLFEAAFAKSAHRPQVAAR